MILGPQFYLFDTQPTTVDGRLMVSCDPSFSKPSPRRIDFGRRFNDISFRKKTSITTVRNCLCPGLVLPRSPFKRLG